MKDEKVIEKNVFFITGGAGTGKTTLTNKILAECPECLPTATTGLAATHINGTTLHKTFGLDHLFDPSDWQAAESHILALENGDGRFRKIKQQLMNKKIFIIDEISMLPADFYEYLDLFVQAARNNPKPFGGLKVVLVGDFLQLPPISKTGCIKRAFESEIWQRDVKPIALTKIYRQTDEAFKEALGKIRYGLCDHDIAELLGSREGAILPLTKKPLILTSRRDKADWYNLQALNNINAPSHYFTGDISGTSETLKTSLLKNCLAPQNLELKIGAQVIALVNREDQGYSNGSMGTIVGFENNIEQGKRPIVEFFNGTRCAIDKYTWKQNNPYHSAQFEQFPLLLAYGLTIHKAQGMTLDTVEVDFQNIFAAGQAYVALSRVTSLDGLSIKNFNPYAIKADKKSVLYHQSIENKGFGNSREILM